ncbi:MAG: hypothetical protein ACI4A8_07995 [Muribaculaceae bacterium]
MRTIAGILTSLILLVAISCSTDDEANETIISLSPDDITIATGESASISVTTNTSSFEIDADSRIISYETSGTTITIAGKAAGSTNLRVRAGNKSAYCHITVTETPPISDDDNSEELSDNSTRCQGNGIDLKADNVGVLFSRGTVSGFISITFADVDSGKYITANVNPHNYSDALIIDNGTEHRATAQLLKETDSTQWIAISTTDGNRYLIVAEK